MVEIMGILDNNNSNQLDFDEFLLLMTSNIITGANLGKFKNYFKNQYVSTFQLKIIHTFA
jgi:Ca2+-binding EF-hand superfamily protein